MPTLLQALNNGFEGIIWVLRTQRNMRVHFLAGAAALVLAVVLGVSRVDLLAVVLAIALVLVTEMINTALEAAVDLAMPDEHPLAKIAKDVAAGGVLISAAAASRSATSCSPTASPSRAARRSTACARPRPTSR